MKRISKNKRGISLIVLVITIIVMIILAAAIILSLNGSNVINKANEAKTDSDKVNLLEAANVALAEYELRVNTGEEVEDELSVYVKKQLTLQGFKQEEINKLDISDDTRTIKYIDSSVPSTVHNGIIPEGGVYYVKATQTGTEDGDYSLATATYRAGNEFPETVNDGDTYVYGDYEYRYNYEYKADDWEYFKSSSLNSWSVTVLDRDKEEYGEILTEINGKVVTSLYYTFYNCRSLTTAPAIPNSVTNMERAFSICTSLSTAPVIPNSVTNMKETFHRCSSLTTTLVIPNSVTNMEGTFSDCTSLSTAPVIPNSVTNMKETFLCCYALTGEVEINADYLEDYEGCFAGTIENIVLIGDCEQLAELTSTTADNNVTVK